MSNQHGDILLHILALVTCMNYLKYSDMYQEGPCYNGFTENKEGGSWPKHMVKDRLTPGAARLGQGKYKIKLLARFKIPSFP